MGTVAPQHAHRRGGPVLRDRPWQSAQGAFEADRPQAELRDSQRLVGWDKLAASAGPPSGVVYSIRNGGPAAAAALSHPTNFTPSERGGCTRLPPCGSL